MKKINLLSSHSKIIIPLFIVLIFLLISCDDEDLSNQQNKYIEFRDYECIPTNNVSYLNEENTISSDYLAYLKSYYYNQDTLKLTIHFWANCCPAFSDSVLISEQRIDIFLRDTLRGCRCICPYDNDFIFLYRQKGALRILFYVANSDNSFTTAVVDTVIYLSSNS